MPRYRNASWGKRFAIASTLFSTPALVYAADDAPRLQVAEQRLILVEPTNGQPVVAAQPSVTAEARVAQLPAQPPAASNASRPRTGRAAEAAVQPVDDGWVARDHIGQRAPLRDPAAITAPRGAASEAGQDTLPPSASADDSLPFGDANGVPTRGSQPVVVPGLQPEPIEASEREVAPALQGLTPVPLMNMVPAEDDARDAAAVERSLEQLAPRAKRSIPVRRPDLTRDVERPATVDPMEQVEDSSVDAEVSLTPAADDRTAEAITKRGDRPKQLSDLFREPAAFNEGDGPSDEAAAEDDEAAAGNKGYVGDWDDQDWQGDHQPPEAKPAREKTQLVITPVVQRMRAPLEAALVYHFQRPEKAPERSSWGMMHSLMVYGVETQVIAGRQRYNLVAWMAGNNICRGQRIFTVDRQGIAPKSGVGLQGHQGQFLAVFGLIGVPDSYPLYVGKRKFSVADLVAREQADCRRGAELTFTLIGLSHYLDTDAEWTASDGQRWDFERLIQEELDQQVIGAACGGTHRLMGLSHALRVRREQGRPMTGQWARAEQFINDFVDYAWKLQNPDGSMSTDWFEGRANRNDLDRKVQTTGHIVEWLIGVLPDEQLQDPRMVKAIGFLTNALYRNRSKEWEIGPKGHALRSLALYHDRVYGDPPPWRSLAIARGAAGGHQRHSR